MLTLTCLVRGRHVQRLFNTKILLFAVLVCLSQVVNCGELLSKWVGESTKNIDAIFEEARFSDAILVFDEAEGLFGSRTSMTYVHCMFVVLSDAVSTECRNHVGYTKTRTHTHT